MKFHAHVLLLVAVCAGLTACYDPTPPLPGGRGRSLDVPPRYGVPPQQTEFLQNVDPANPSAAAVQPPDPLTPIPGDNVTPPAPNAAGTTAPPPVTVAPPTVTPPSPPAPAPVPAEIPVASRIPGKPGFVKSPFDTNGQPIDVRDFQSGQKAKCPYTGKIFRVP